MAFVITEPCIDVKDRECVTVCPVECIYDDGDEDRQLYINPVECITCNACVEACPVAAIFDEEEIPVKWQGFTRLNALYFEDKQAARIEINRLYPTKQTT